MEKKLELVNMWLCSRVWGFGSFHGPFTALHLVLWNFNKRTTSLLDPRTWVWPASLTLVHDKE